MTIVWASASLALSIFLFGLAFQQFRRPGLSGWLASDLAAQLVCVVIVGLFIFACSALARLTLSADIGDFAGMDNAAALAVLTLASLAAYRLVLRGRRQSLAAMASGAEMIAFSPPPASAGGDPVKPARPRRPRRKAA
jgi:hypothetical protein